MAKLNNFHWNWLILTLHEHWCILFSVWPFGFCAFFFLHKFNPMSMTNSINSKIMTTATPRYRLRAPPRDPNKLFNYIRKQWRQNWSSSYLHHISQTGLLIEHWESGNKSQPWIWSNKLYETFGLPSGNFNFAGERGGGHRLWKHKRILSSKKRGLKSI